MKKVHRWAIYRDASGNPAAEQAIRCGFCYAPATTWLELDASGKRDALRKARAFIKREAERCQV